MLIVEGQELSCRTVGEVLSDVLDIACMHSVADFRQYLEAGHDDVRLALIELNLPDGNGLELADELAATSPHTHVVLCGSNPTPDELESALNRHVAGFLRLPLDRDQLRDVVQRTLSLPPRCGGLGSFINGLHTDLRRQTDVVLKSRRAGLLALARLAEFRDTDTGRHVERVSKFALCLTRELRSNGPYGGQFDDVFEASIEMAAALHDIGKVAIPDEVLHKPGRLTKPEFDLMKTHCDVGSKVIDAALAEAPDDPALRLARQVVRGHHERWDGSGYPDGLAREDIPIAARIVSVIDAYDAMRSNRVYNPARARENTVKEILRCSGTHFDPIIVSAFERCEGKIDELGRSIERITARWTD